MNKTPSIYLNALLSVSAVCEFLREAPDFNQNVVNYSYWIINTLVILAGALRMQGSMETNRKY
jgi:hypothetical protein